MNDKNKLWEQLINDLYPICTAAGGWYSQGRHRWMALVPSAWLHRVNSNAMIWATPAFNWLPRVSSFKFWEPPFRLFWWEGQKRTSFSAIKHSTLQLRFFNINCLLWWYWTRNYHIGDRAWSFSGCRRGWGASVARYCHHNYVTRPTHRYMEHLARVVRSFTGGWKPWPGPILTLTWVP